MSRVTRDTDFGAGTGSTACFHCGLPIPSGVELSFQLEGVSQRVCCHGCKAVAEAIVAGGYEDFYRHRTASSRKPGDLVPEVLRELDEYRILAFGALLVVMMIVRPEGLWPSTRRKLELYEHVDHAAEGAAGPVTGD